MSRDSKFASLKQGVALSALAYLAKYIVSPNLSNPTLLEQFLDACSPLALASVVVSQAVGSRKATIAFAAVSLLLAGACVGSDWFRSKKLLARPLEPADSYAIVTGASSGLGRSMAYQLAGRGFHLILVARREEQLQLVKESIQAQHPGINVIIFPADVGNPQFAHDLHARLTELSICNKVDVLISNAGFAVHGPFIEHKWEQAMNLIDVNIRATTAIVHTFLPDMVSRRRGRVGVISSITGHCPNPNVAEYAATKAYLSSFAQALYHELMTYNDLHVTTVLPGATHTDFAKVSHTEKALVFRVPGMSMEADVAAEMAVEGILLGKPVVTLGAVNKFYVYFLSRVLPARAAMWVAQLAWDTGDRVAAS